MSAKKVTDTKIPEDSEYDSGVISGPIDEWPDSGVISSEIPSEDQTEEKNVPSEEKTVPTVTVQSDMDSGVLDVYEDFSSLSLEPRTVVPTRPADSKAAPELPPLHILFKQDDDGDTQLHIAAYHGSLKAISTLIKICPCKELLDVQNDEGHTALHLAVMSQSAVATRMLVIAGASLAVRDRKGDTPLHKATALKNVECIKALLNRVPEQRERRISTVLNQKNYNGQACVHLAAASGHLPTMQALLYYGVDVNCKENLAGWSALHVAAARGHAALAELLLRAPGLCARARDHAGRAPRLRRLLPHAPLDDDSDSDDDEYDYDSETESLFERIREGRAPPLVA